MVVVLSRRWWVLKNRSLEWVVRMETVMVSLIPHQHGAIQVTYPPPATRQVHHLNIILACSVPIKASHNAFAVEAKIFISVNNILI